MSPWHTTLDRQLEELTLIQCSLLPGEHFTFILPPSDLALWQSLLDDDGDGDDTSTGRRSASLTDPPCPARFEMRVEGANRIWFQVQLPSCSKTPSPTPVPTPIPGPRQPQDTHANTTLANTSIALKAENLSRDDHERWNAVIRERMAEIDDACDERSSVVNVGRFPVYDLLTLLLSHLHDQSTTTSSPTRIPTLAPTTPIPTPTPTTPTPTTPTPTPNHHALLTSHHLISTTKRRLMHQWSHDLNIAGFAKVGYPGIVYAEGPREAVEEFVGNVKGMQWLALRVRFQEPVLVPVPNSWNVDELARSERWMELSKIGEVLEQMRKRGREALVTSLGIGAPSKELKQSSS